jgi:hypothetical protein
MDKRRKFPILAVLLLVFAIFWLLSETDILVIDIPWIPIILIIIAIGMIWNRLKA